MREPYILCLVDGLGYAKMVRITFYAPLMRILSSSKSAPAEKTKAFHKPSSPELGDRVRSFSRPEKLPLKIHTGSSGDIYSYWVGKALLFPNWSSFSRQTPRPYVFNFSQIFSQP